MIVELRQYTHQPGRRDEFVELFEGPLYDPLEAAGMDIIGVFGDLDDSDRTVWLRSFPDMAARLAALEDFYNSDLWWSHRDAVNATLVDSDNVLLLNAVVEPHAVGEPGALHDGRLAVRRSLGGAGRRGTTRSRFSSPSTARTTSRGSRCARARTSSCGSRPATWSRRRLGADPVQTLRLAPTGRSRLT